MSIIELSHDPSSSTHRNTSDRKTCLYKGLYGSAPDSISHSHKTMETPPVHRYINSLMDIQVQHIYTVE